MREAISSLAALIILFLFLPPVVLAQTYSKRVEVNLTNQHLYAFERDKLVYNFPISSGKAWWPTPTGEFKPWTKLRYDRMIGGDRRLGTYYDLPNVPFVVYFYKSYAIHGTYWHNNFGVPMSHGCINVSTTNMAVLYNWIDMNTQIKIYGITPRG